MRFSPLLAFLTDGFEAARLRGGGVLGCAVCVPSAFRPVRYYERHSFQKQGSRVLFLRLICGGFYGRGIISIERGGDAWIVAGYIRLCPSLNYSAYQDLIGGRVAATYGIPRQREF